MMQPRLIAWAVVMAAVVLLAAPSAQAQWVVNGAAVSVMSLTNQEQPDICPDGFGGAIIVWRDTRNLGQDIYAQRIDALGRPLWTGNGEAVCTNSSLQTEPCVVSDGAGGAVIAWTDSRSPTDIYAQRLDDGGNALWTANGVVVCAATNVQQHPVITTDGAGGAIIAWQDFRNSSHDNIYAQRVLSNGTTYWTTDGVALCTASNNQTYPVLAPDGNGGAHVVWQDGRQVSNLDVYMDKVDKYGSVTWGSDGLGVCTASGNQWAPQVTADGFGGAVVVWYDFRGSDADIYAQRINSVGTASWTWDGIAICTATGDQTSAVAVSNGTGGAIVAWRDYRSAQYAGYAQRVDGDGSIQWTSNGIRLCTYGYGMQRTIRAVTDGQGGAIVSWQDNRTGKEDVYCQRIDETGAVLWDSYGVPLSTAYDDQTTPCIAEDGSGGAIVAWDDYRNAYHDIYAQRIERNGYWGYPAPEIASVSDVPADQGGYVNLQWDASRLDPWPEELIDHYSLWRALDPAQAAAMLKSGAILVSGVSELPFDAGDRVLRWERVSGTDYYWELVATQIANGYEHYARLLPSPFDSTASSSQYQYFQVSAHASDPLVNWTSAPDSGYSVDNLAPAQPQSLAGDQSISPVGLNLTWDPNSEVDLSHYAVYRGTSSDFVPGPGNHIDSPSDTTSFDGDWTWDSGYYYKVSAVDIHGNESTFAVLAPDNVTGVRDADVPRLTFLSQNFPNPFVRETSIAFGIDEPGEVSLEVYDVAGRLVRVLVSGTRNANRYLETWDGRDGSGKLVSSGVYFYRLRTASFKRSMKMLLVR
jgi:hypothetical protein